MPSDEFWNGDPWFAAAYWRAGEIERQRKSDEMYLQGVYNFKAFSTAIGNAFRSKGTRPQNYLEEPIRIIPYTEEEKEAIARRERKKTIAYFERLLKKQEKKNEH